MSSPNQRRKFSLLHVVLATVILVFLVAVLVPVHAEGGPSPRSQALSNLKMVATAGIIYCSDYDELLPQYGHWEMERPASGTWIRGNQVAWKSALMPYIKNEELFFYTQWPFRKREGTSLQLARGVTNGASCFGYVAEITPKWFGSKDGSLHLNPADPPDGFLKELGVDQANAPLLEDLAWAETGWFGKIHVHRILDKSGPGKRMVGYMDCHVKTIPATESGQAEPS